MAFLFLGYFVKTGLGDKLGPPKLSAGVSNDSCADAVTAYAKDDICLSTLSSLLVDLNTNIRTGVGKLVMEGK